jgi:hypothetical protein
LFSPGTVGHVADQVYGHVQTAAAAVLAAPVPPAPGGGVDTSKFQNWGLTQGIGVVAVVIGLLICFGAGKGNIPKAMHQATVFLIGVTIAVLGTAAVFLGQWVLSMFGISA